MRNFDLCVIGSGPAGQKAAIQAAKLGKRVCVIERREFVGGVAIHTGTIPSKALREAILSQTRRDYDGNDYIEDRDELFSGLLESCNKVIRAEVSVVRHHFARNGIEMVYGSAMFEDPHTLRVVSARGDEDRVRADNIMIAVGTRPARPPEVEFDDATIITSDDLLRLSHLPHSMCVVGGGVIGTEYASMLSALGVRVTLIEGRSRILDFVDSELIEALQYHLRQSGMTLRLGEKVTRIERVEAPREARTADGIMAEVILESGKTLRADSLLYAIGRQGATEELGLSNAGLESDSRGRIRVNDNFRTQVEHIYAVGDVIGFPSLASTSMEQGRLAVCDMIKKSCTTVPELLPYGIYSIPEISMVGWTEERLTAEGIPFEAGIAQYKEIARGQLLGDDTGMLKLLIHQDTLHVLGVHIIGTGATELVHIGQAAIAFNATIEYFINTVFNYPTLAECYRVAALNGLNKIRHQ